MHPFHINTLFLIVFFSEWFILVQVKKYVALAELFFSREKYKQAHTELEKLKYFINQNKKSSFRTFGTILSNLNFYLEWRSFLKLIFKPLIKCQLPKLWTISLCKNGTKNFFFSRRSQPFDDSLPRATICFWLPVEVRVFRAFPRITGEINAT